MGQIEEFFGQQFRINGRMNLDLEQFMISHSFKIFNQICRIVERSELELTKCSNCYKIRFGWKIVV